MRRGPRQARGPGAIETAQQADQNCGRIFRYASLPAGPSAIRLPIAVVPSRRFKEKHHAALTNPNAMGELLRAIDGYRGSFVTGAEPGLYVGS
jgi:hypothetical protein